jgi:phenylacetate-CoA ligase
MGDIAYVEWKDGKPEIKYVEGRDNEYFVLADGTKIGCLRAYDIFKESMNVVESQIRLKAPDHIELVVVKGQNYKDKDEKEILREARKYFSEIINVSIRYVDKVERAKNGKFKVLVSEVE